MSQLDRPNSVNTSVQEFVERLHAADTIDALWREILREYANYDIEHLIYMFMRPSAPFDRPLIFSNLPDWWKAHYENEKLARHDPFFITCHTFAPIRTGREYIRDHSSVLLPEQKRFIAEAGETGAINGVSSPVKLANPGHFGGWNFLTGLKRAQFEKLIAAHCERLQFIGFVAHEALLEAASKPGKRQQTEGNLSQRERECLLWLARGLRSVEIADKLGIALVTVDLYFKRARTKLKAATREEALAKAILSGEVNL